MCSQESGQRKVCPRLPQDENLSPWWALTTLEVLPYFKEIHLGTSRKGLHRDSFNYSYLQEVVLPVWPEHSWTFCATFTGREPGAGEFGFPDVYITSNKQREC